MIPPSNPYSAMNATFEANIGQLLGESRRERIVVPEFQRGYEWRKEHIEDFWKDIVELQSERSLKDGRKRHFLGPIVVLQREGEVWELLDGQQRLATTTILFSVIRDAAAAIKIKDGETFAADTHNNYVMKGADAMALTLGETDETFFRETIQVFPPIVKKPIVRTNRNIEAARKILANKVQAALGDTSTPTAQISFLRELRKTVISDLTVACIPVADEREAFKIFETLNDRGLQLAAPDLLFNLLMQKADKKDRKVMRGLWTDIIESMGVFDLKDFLRAYWVSKHGDIKKADLFTVLRSEVEKGTLKPLPFIRECAAEVDCYVSIVGVDASALKEATGPVKSLVLEMASDVPVPLLLSAFHKLSAEHHKEFNKLCRSMLVFIVRYSVLGGLDRAGIEDILYAQARKMRSAEKPVRLLATLIDEYVKNAPEDGQIDHSKIILNPTSARYLMPKIAEYMQSKSREWTSNDAANIEHIYPKNPKPDEWGGLSAQAVLDEYVWHIGNLTVMAEKLNTRAANSEYHLKRPHYEKSAVVMTRKLAEDYDQWNEKKISWQGAKYDKPSQANLAIR